MAAIDDDRLNLVSSLYGPGTVLGWLFLALSCFVKFIFPTKSSNNKNNNEDENKDEDTNRNSIDTDLIGFAAYGALVAGDLIATIRKSNPQTFLLNTSLDNETLANQQIAALEASLGTAENCMAICLLLFVAATLTKSLKRAIVVAVLGLFNFSAEIFLRYRHGSLIAELTYLSGNLLVRFGALFTATVTVVSILFVLAAMVVSKALVNRYQRDIQEATNAPLPSLSSNETAATRTATETSTNETLNQTNESNDLNELESAYTQIQIQTQQIQQIQQRKHYIRTRTHLISQINIYWLNIIALFSLPLSCLSGITDFGFVEALYSKGHDVVIQTGWPRLVSVLIPQSNQRLANLDQVLALLLGVIAFTLAVSQRGWEFYRSRVESDERYEFLEVRRMRRQRPWPGQTRRPVEVH